MDHLAQRHGRFGWIPDYPDFRDYTADTQSVREMLLPTGIFVGEEKSPLSPLYKRGGKPAIPAIKSEKNFPLSSLGPDEDKNSPLYKRGERGDLSGDLRENPSVRRTSSAHARRTDKKLPASVDLRAYCSPVEDQGALGSCTAQAGAGVIEYYERRAFGRHLDASRLFLYKVTRNLMKMTGDTGAYLRTTIGAMVLFGVPSEEYWPYTDDSSRFDREPPAFCYSFAQNFKTIQYFRHDPPGTSPATLLLRVKTHLAAGHPSLFGFTVYTSIEKADERGAIPFPAEKERILGGHAVVAVGYDDAFKIKSSSSPSSSGSGASGPPTTGALLIRNSWGEEWGEAGYGRLPYEYIKRGLAEDFWSVLKKDWVDTGAFNV